MLALVAALLVPACPAQGEPLSIAETVNDRPYTYQTTKVEETYFALLHRDKPFLGGGGDRMGYFDYDWDVALRLDADERVSRACFETAYEVHYPAMPTARLKRCFRRVTNHVERHERAHVEVTRRLVAQTGEAVIGATREEALALLEALDPAIIEANEAFHQTPEGSAPPRYRRPPGC